MTDTLPGHDNASEIAVQVDASVEDSRTHAMWVHKDLVQVRKDWEIGPPRADEKFGDVESWTGYLKRFVGPDGGGDFPPFLTWNSQGLRAVLDYHEHVSAAGRLQWTASHPFVESPEWEAWMGIATGHGVSQAKAIEFLEDHSPDITTPDAASLMAILGTLRATVNKSATTELRPDGTASVTWAAANNVAARNGTADLPAEFTITIPVLKGHDVRYALAVRLRASVDDQAHLSLRFSIPLAERALEAVFADQVATAKGLLGDGFSLLRAAG
jgi:hypothetical protein